MHFKTEDGKRVEYNMAGQRVDRSAAARKAAETRKRRDAEWSNTEAIDSVAVGDIMYGSRGYDQTNVEFYQVIARSGRMVTLREVSRLRNDTGNMTERVYPCRDQFTNAAPIRRQLSRWGSVKLERWGIYLTKLDPAKDDAGKYASHYA